jgi:hypothetical protein
LWPHLPNHRLFHRMADAADAPPPGLHDLADELLHAIGDTLADDLCAGAASLARLSRCCTRLRAVYTDREWLAGVARMYGPLAPAPTASPTLELLGVAEAVAALGTNRVYFQRRGLAQNHTIRPGSSMPRIVEFALLLRRHPRLRLAIDGHEGANEAAYIEAADGTPTRASLGASQRRADAVYAALLGLECLEELDARGNRVWGRLCQPRFEPRITRCRGWEHAVAHAAGWHGGLETAHAEIFVSLDGVEVPARGPHYLALTSM